MLLTELNCLLLLSMNLDFDIEIFIRLVMEELGRAPNLINVGSNENPGIKLNIKYRNHLQLYPNI